MAEILPLSNQTINKKNHSYRTCVSTQWFLVQLKKKVIIEFDKHEKIFKRFQRIGCNNVWENADILSTDIM